MATQEQLQTALVNAHNAGDTEAATALATELKRMRDADQLASQNKQIGDVAKGLGDAALTIGTGGVATVAGLVPAALQSAANLSHGEAPDFENNYANAINRMTWEPRTEKGADYAEQAGDFINRNVVPVAPMVGVGAMGVGDAVLASRAHFKALDKAAAPKRGIDAAAVTQKLEAQPLDRPQLKSRMPGTQGNLFPESNEGLASPYDASVAGVTEPITPQRQARQMGLPFGMDTIPITKEGQGVLSPVDAMARDKYEAELRARRVADMTNETQQQPLFDHPESGRPPMANEAVPGDWRVDENGIPIKADLSMEAQNLENPLQRNLFGDELSQKHEQEAPTGMMQSMNDTADALNRTRSFESFDRLKQMQDEQNALLRGGIDAPGQLEAAKLQSEIMDPNVRGGDPRIGFNFKKQGGAVNPEVFKQGFQKLKQLADGTWLRAHNDGMMFHVDAIKDGHNLAHVEFAPEYIDRLNSDERNLKAYMTHVRGDMRGKGYAEAMYKFASELGNDVQKSDTLTPEGRKMWDSWERRGVAKGGMFNKQRGAINPDVFKEGFEKIKKLANGLTAKASGSPEYLTVTLYKGNNEVGSAHFRPEDRGGPYPHNYNDPHVNAVSNETWIASEHRGKGYATELYKFVRDLGNDVKASDDQTSEGQGMWKGFEKSGLAQKGVIKSPGRKQQGAIFTRPKDENARKVLDNIPGIQGKLKGIAPSKWTPEEAVEAAKNAPDLTQTKLQKLSNFFTKGGQYMIDRSDNNPVIRYGVEKVQEAERQTRADIANMLHDKDFGLGAKTRNMDAVEQKNIWSLVNWADLNQHELTPEFLAEHNATPAQIEYAKTHREVMDYAHEQMNKVMATLGKPPVSKRVAYAAMNASGDYRRLVYKGDDVVGMIGSDLSWRVDGLKNELEKRGYTVGEERYVGAKSRDMGSAQREMAQMLEWFSQKDPRIEEMLHTVAEVTSNLAKNFMNMEVHTKAKKGIFGFDGRKAVDGLEWGGHQLTRDKALANAREGLKAQMNYAETAIKWGHLAEAAKDVKEVLSHKDIADKQPMAKQWTEDYLSHAMGHNPVDFARNFEEGVAKMVGATGVGYSVVRGGIAGSRRIVNTVLLGLNPAFWATNVIQPFQAMPGMRAYLVSKGLRADFDLGTGYAYLGKGGISAWKAGYAPGKLTGIEKAAFDYARDHHVYGSDLIEHSSHVHKGFSFHSERISSSVSGSIESATRSPMYYGFVHLLHENGMSIENGLFETAHNLTDMAMNNYSRTDRPMVYDAMGSLGEVASNLSSYKHNELSRVAMFAREALKGNAKPLAVHLLTGIVYTGIKGTIAYNAVDWLTKEISAYFGHPISITKALMELSEGLHTGHVLSHGAFSLLGVDMSNRLGLNDALTPNLFPGGSKLADIAGAAYTAVKDHNEASVKQLIHEASPGIATGPEELAWFSKGNLGSRKSDLSGAVYRTPGDKVAKALGFTGIHEAVEKQKLYENKWINDAYTQRRQEVANTMKGEIYMDKIPSPKSIQKYMDARGDVQSLMTEIDRIGRDQNMSQKDREMMKATAMKTAAAQGHLRDLTESFK